MALNWEAAKRRDQATTLSRPSVSTKGVVAVAKRAGDCPRCPRHITKGDFIVKKNGEWGCCS